MNCWITVDHLKNLIEQKLGRFCSGQRSFKRENNLSHDRVAKLELVSCWYWDLDAKWNKNADDLLAWIEQNHKLPNAKSNNLIEKKLGNFYAVQTKNKNKNKLSPDRTIKLKCLWEKEDPWMINYNLLLELIFKNGKIPSTRSTNYIEKKIATFCSTQRRNKKKGLLSDDKIKKLEGIEGWFWMGVSNTQLKAKAEKMR